MTVPPSIRMAARRAGNNRSASGGSCRRPAESMTASAIRTCPEASSPVPARSADNTPCRRWSTRGSSRSARESWVESTQVVPPAAASSSALTTRSALGSSSSAVGSSATTSAGACIKAAATARRCCSPPES